MRQERSLLHVRKLLIITYNIVGGEGGGRAVAPVLICNVCNTL